LIDDPIGSLASIEERFTEKGIEVIRVWDVIEAENKFSSQKYDGIVASMVSILGDAVTFCLSSKQKSDSPIITCLYTPYLIDEDDTKFLESIGIDVVSNSLKKDIIFEKMIKWLESDDRKVSNVADQIDNRRITKIANESYYAALKDLSSKAMKLDEILENASDVIYELDPYGRIILISKVIEKMTGYSRDELIGMSALDVTSADSLEVVADHISMLLSGQVDPPNVEVGVQCKNGHIIPAEMIVRPIRHKNQVVGILGIGRNVEERKRYEENIRRVINEKDFYLDLMSHDIQNFNTGIVGYLEMILSSNNLDPKVERFAKGAFRQVMQTASLIAHLKRVAHIRQFGTNSMERRDLHEILQRSVTNIHSKSSKDNLAITLNCSTCPCPIIAGDDIDDMLEILISSAVRYSLSDLLHLKISVSPEIIEGKNYWAITISGNNLRLSKSIVQCVMSQDFSGCQMIDRPDLQLLVVRAIVETQNGWIETISQENGRGDKFVIRIPQA